MIDVVSVIQHRSKPLVNMPDDMVRVTLDMEKWQWRVIREELSEYMNKEANNDQD